MKLSSHKNSDLLEGASSMEEQMDKATLLDNIPGQSHLNKPIYRKRGTRR
jgi:glucose-6-phosphate isomerase